MHSPLTVQYCRCVSFLVGLRLSSTRMKRREFVALVGGATAWPLAARAQQAERMRRIGVLMSTGSRRCGRQSPNRGVPGGAAEIGLDRRPYHAYRHALAGQHAGGSQIFGRTGRACSRRAPRNRQREPSPICWKRPGPCLSCS